MKLKDVKPGQWFRMKGNYSHLSEMVMVMGSVHPDLCVTSTDLSSSAPHKRVMLDLKSGMLYVLGFGADLDREVTIVGAGSSAEQEQRASTPPVGGSSPSPRASTTHDEVVYHIGMNGVRFNGATVFFRRRKNALGDMWRAGVALCHKDDAFDTRVGERLARQRASLVRYGFSHKSYEATRGDATRLVNNVLRRML